MDKAPVELWLPSRGDGLPECLLGVPLLVRPGGEADSLFRLVTSSVWTPLTFGDAVRARPHPDGGYSIRALGGPGPRTRVVVAYDPSLPAMRARTQVAEWDVRGADIVETLPGLFVIAWRGDTDAEAIRDFVADAGPAWQLVELWAAQDRTPGVIAAHLES